MTETPQAFAVVPPQHMPEWVRCPSEAVQRLIDLLHEYEFQDGDRRKLVFVLAGVVLEHHHAIILLLRHNLNSAALSMGRVLAESLIKTMWATSLAKDTQVQKIIRGGGFPELKSLIESFQVGGQVGGEMWAAWKLASYAKLCDYAHTGPNQLAHWLTDSDLVAPNPPDAELIKLADESTIYAFIAVSCIAEVNSDRKLQEQMAECLVWWERCAATNAQLD